MIINKLNSEWGENNEAESQDEVNIIVPATVHQGEI